MDITIVSFGFKHGQPQADLVWDVRFLPNPYWVPELQAHSGLEPEVANHVLANPEAEQFLALLGPLLHVLVEIFTARGRELLTLAVGCTGGKHRSVAVAEHLGRMLAAKGLAVTVQHRDLGKE